MFATFKQAVSGANKLINEKVVGVVGAYCSSATIPASEVLDPEGVVMITPASTSPKVTERGLKHVFRICGRDDDQGPAAVKFMTDELKAKTVYIVDDKTTYSQGLADKVEETAGKVGLKVLEHEHVNKGDADFSAVLTKIKAANPDVFYMSLQNSEAGSNMAKQAKRLGITAKIVGQDAVYHPDLIRLGQDAVQGAFLTFGYIDEDSASYKKFIEKYSAMPLLTAIKNAKSTDGAKIRAELIELDMDGASKRIKFKDNGDSGSNYVIYKVEGDKFVKFWDPQTGKKF